VFNTKVLENGIIRIPELVSWKDLEISVLIRKKVREVQKKKNTKANNELLINEFRRIRNIKSPNAKVLTIENSINIYSI